MMALRISWVILVMLAFCLSVAAAEPEYKLAPLDIFSVTVLRHDELSKTYTVPPDGVIDFPRVGRVNVIGKTTAEIAELTKIKLSEWLRDPNVTVTLSQARTKNAFVLGEVARPGQYPLTAGARITELLAAAGDVLPTERNRLSARLLRGQKTIPIDLQIVLSGKTPEANLVLQEGDLLWIEAPAKISVMVSGNVVRTSGLLKLLVGSTVMDAMAAAGDLTDRPERCVLNLTRGAKTEKLSWGDVKTVLQDGDIILVEKEPIARVYVNGHVRTPGEYELPEGGDVLKAIAKAGGVLENPALTKVMIIRRGGSLELVDLTAAFTGGEVGQLPKLGPDDQVVVPENTSTIAVLGYVNRPGTFPFNPARPPTVIDAIGLAGDTTKRAKSSATFVIRKVNGQVQRIDADVIAILKKKKTELNITLQAGDIVYVPPTNMPDIGPLLPLLGFIL
ncbi:MAG: SLBB domain-containing protein [Armatimonadota bacterium]